MPLSSSFRGPSEAREPGIHTPQRLGLWIPGPRHRDRRFAPPDGASRNDSPVFASLGTSGTMSRLHRPP